MADAPDAGPRGRDIAAVVAAGLALMLVPVWVLPWFPSQDGPIHVHLVELLRELLHGASPLVERFHVVRHAIEPNLLGYLILYPLGAVVGPAVGEKVLVSLCVVGFVAGADRVLAAISREARVYIVLFLPFAAGLFVHLGFYNFSLGTVLYLWGLAAWLRRLERPAPLGLRSLVSLSAFGFVLALTHLLPFLLFGLTVGGTFVASRVVVAARDGRWAEEARAALRGGLAIVAALAPGALLVVGFFVRHGVGGETLSVGYGPGARIAHALALWPASSFHWLENAACAPLVAVLAWLFVLRVRARLAVRALEPADALLAATVGLAGFFLFGNLSSKGVPVADRLLPVLYSLSFAWLATSLPPPRMRRAVLVVGALVMGALGCVRIGLYARIAPEMRDYLSLASDVDEDRTLLALNFVLAEEHVLGVPLRRVDPFQHASSRIALVRHDVDLRSSLLSTRVFGYFPVVYREELDPYRSLGMYEWGIEAVPPFVSLEHYERTTGATVDYVLVRYGDPEEWRDDEAAHHLAAQLATRYREKARSAGGRAALFERLPLDRLPLPARP